MSFDLRSHRYPSSSSSSLEQRSEGKAHSSVRSADCSMLPVTRSSSGAPAYVTLARNGGRYRIRPLCPLSEPASFLPSSRPSRPFNVLARSLPSPSLGLSLRHSIGGEAVKNVPARKLRSRHSFRSLSRGLARSLSGQRPCSPSQFARPSVDLALS